MIFNTILNMRNIVKACNYNNLITTQGVGTWKATKDCWIIGCVDRNNSAGEYGALYIDGNEVVSARMANDVDDGVSFSLYVKRGSTITIFSKGKYNAFGCLP
jgi:hypothetical protein